MPKLKTVLMLFVIITFAMLLTGCDMFFAREPSSDQENASQEAGMPSWLLLSHRSIEDPDLEESSSLPKSPETDDANDSDDHSAVETTTDTAAPSGESSTIEQEHPTDNDEIKPGTMEWIIEMKKQEEAEREARKKAAEEEAEKDDEDETEDETEEKKWYELGNDSDSSFTLETNINQD